MKKVDYCLSFPENSRTRNLDLYSESYDSFNIAVQRPDTILGVKLKGLVEVVDGRIRTAHQLDIVEEFVCLSRKY